MARDLGAGCVAVLTVWLLSPSACVVEIPDVVPAGGGGAGGAGGAPSFSVTATTLALGPDFSCAIRRDGGGVARAYCWGAAATGVVPAPAPQSMSDAPIAVTGPADVVEITAGQAHACALEAGGRAWCWGDDSMHQLGRAQPNSPPAPDLVQRCADGACAPLEGIVSIRAGQASTCALLEDHTVVCWGSNLVGILGTSGDYDPTPQPVGPSVLSIDRAASLAVGRWHACVQQPKRVVCWGHNEVSQCGKKGYSDGNADSFEGDDFERVPVEGPAVDYASLSLSHESSCGVTAEGVLECWGNAAPALDVQEREDATNFLGPFISKSIASVAVGRHACAVHHDGSVSCWGPDAQGQVGDGGGAAPEGERLPPAVLQSLDSVVAVAVGAEHTCARRSNDDVLCWGRCDQGQSGQGCTNLRDAPGQAVEFPP
jgi:alpha-tubulin suppressor-like RCC1 family protein